MFSIKGEIIYVPSYKWDVYLVHPTQPANIPLEGAISSNGVKKVLFLYQGYTQGSFKQMRGMENLVFSKKKIKI